MVRADLLAKPEASFLKWRGAADPAFAGCVWLEPLGQGLWDLGSLATDPAQQQAGLGGNPGCGQGFGGGFTHGSSPVLRTAASTSAQTWAWS